jgi:hypothetical protein
MRDTVDRRITREAYTKTITYTSGGNGSINGIIDTQSAVGGWPVYNQSDPLSDTDSDGIPDLWEEAYKLDKTNGSDSKLTTLDPAKFYTNLEIYLAHLVQHITAGQLSEGTPSGTQTSLTHKKEKTRFEVWKANQNIIKYEAGSVITSIQVFSINGVLHITQKPNHFAGEFSLENHPAGVYMIRVQFDNNTFETRKIIRY